MVLLFLHGPPAVGKLTVAKRVAEHTGWRLFHNHLTVDLVLSVYDFGTPGFVALREEIWTTVLRRAREDRLPGLIFTFNPENSVPQRFITELFRDSVSDGHELVSIALTAPEAEIERRIGSESRREKRKLVDLDLYRALREQGVFTAPSIPQTDLAIDTARHTPSEAAAEICAFLQRRQSERGNTIDRD
jgi:hypothetical protein